MLGYRLEREANDFAHSLLVDGLEALAAGMTRSRDIADYFGVPGEFVRLQPPLGWEGATDWTLALP